MNLALTEDRQSPKGLDHIRRFMLRIELRGSSDVLYEQLFLAVPIINRTAFHQRPDANPRISRTLID